MSTAVEFLKNLRPGGPWVLTAIVPDGATETITATNADGVAAFVDANNGKKNIYYSVNPTRTALTKKAAKTDIVSIEYLLADLDPNKGESPADAKARYLASVAHGPPIPTAIIDSGNGIQVLWRLAEPIPLAEPITVKGKKVFPPETAALIADVEARQAAMMVRLGSVAGTQNIDRILRLPGTTNLPNTKKLKEGRVACPTKLISFNGVSDSLEDFPAPDQPKAAQPKAAEGKAKAKGTGINALPVSKRIKNLIRGIDHPDYVYATRSEAMFAVIVAMVSTGCADDFIATVLLDTGYPISAHVLEQSNPQQYLAKQIANVREERAKRIPVIGQMRKSDDPAIWYVNIGNKEIKITDSKDLNDYKRFNNQCIKQLDRCFAPLKPQEWADILDNALANMKTVEALEETTRTGRFKEQMQTLLTNRAVGEKREDILRQLPWDDEKNKRYVFTINAVEKFLEREKVFRNIERPEIADLLHAIGAVHIKNGFTVKKGEQRRCWWIAYDKIKKAPELDPPDKEEDFI